MPTYKAMLVIYETERLGGQARAVGGHLVYKWLANPRASLCCYWLGGDLELFLSCVRACLPAS